MHKDITNLEVTREKLKVDLEKELADEKESVLRPQRIEWVQAIHNAVKAKENELEQAQTKLTAAHALEGLLGKVGPRPECPNH